MRLPFNLKTIANTYQPEAFVSGIVFARSQKHMPYFLSNYMRIIYDKNATVNLGYYIDNHILKNHGLIKEECAFISMKYAVKGVDFAQLAARALDNGKYVFGAFNDGCIPGKSAYPNQYFWHDYLLYGYEKDEFISAAYLKDGFYREFKINMQDYNRAMIIKESDIFIYMLEYDEQSELGFNLEMVKAGLNDYLTGKKLAEGDAVYGIRAFRRYADDLERFPESYPDKRYFCFAWEYKNLMRLRLEYMREHNYILLSQEIIEEYAEMTQKLHKGVLLALKYALKPEREIINKLIEIIRESAEQDERVIEMALKQL